MFITTSEYEGMLEEYIQGEIFEEKIKWYLEIYVSKRCGNLLDTAKHVLFFDLGLGNKMHDVLLPLGQRIEIMSLILAKYMSEKEVNKEIRKIPAESTQDAHAFMSEYYKQLSSMQLVQLTKKH